MMRIEWKEKIKFVIPVAAAALIGTTAYAVGSSKSSDSVTITTAATVPVLDEPATTTTTTEPPAEAAGPFIPGPAKPGDKIAVVPRDKPEPAKSGVKVSYPKCPAEGAVTDAKLYANGCVERTDGPAERYWLRTALIDCLPGRGQALVIGPSAPRPLGWGYIGKGFTWDNGDLYERQCHGRATYEWWNEDDFCPAPAWTGTSKMPRQWCLAGHIYLWNRDHPNQQMANPFEGVRPGLLPPSYGGPSS